MSYVRLPNGGPRVRILLPPVVSRQTIRSSAAEPHLPSPTSGEMRPPVDAGDQPLWNQRVGPALRPRYAAATTIKAEVPG